jgi:hypothetical protein
METRHRTKTNKVKTLHKKLKKINRMKPTKNPGVKLHSQRITQG